jgi:hypothetical protein
MRERAAFGREDRLRQAIVLLSGFHSGHIGKEFGQNEYGSLISQAIVSMTLIV